MLHSMQYAYRDRRDRTGDFRQLWITRINAGTVIELFITADAIGKHPDIVAAIQADKSEMSVITEDGLKSLAETVTPQGMVAVCHHLDVTLSHALTARPRLVAVLAGIRDPGNAGTVLRTADAAGAEAVIFAGDTVDPYNGKCVRASAGSLFHVDVVRAADPATVIVELQTAGYTVLAADPYGAADLDD